MNQKPPINSAVRLRPGRVLDLRQVIALQELCYGKSLEPGTKATDVAALTRSWCLLAEAKRVLRNKMKPGSINGTMMKEPQFKAARRGPIVDVEAVVRQLKRQEALAEESA